MSNPIPVDWRGRSYSGAIARALQFIAKEKGFSSNKWFTKKKAQELRLLAPTNDDEGAKLGPRFPILFNECQLKSNIELCEKEIKTAFGFKLFDYNRFTAISFFENNPQFIKGTAPPIVVSEVGAAVAFHSPIVPSHASNFFTTLPGEAKWYSIRQTVKPAIFTPDNCRRILFTSVNNKPFSRMMQYRLRWHAITHDAWGTRWGGKDIIRLCGLKVGCETPFLWETEKGCDELYNIADDFVSSPSSPVGL